MLVWAPSSKPKYLMRSRIMSAELFLQLMSSYQHTRRRAGQALGNAGQVDDDGFDTVALALNLGPERLHLVAIEGILLILQ